MSSLVKFLRGGPRKPDDDVTDVLPAQETLDDLIAEANRIGCRVRIAQYADHWDVTIDEAKLFGSTLRAEHVATPHEGLRKLLRQWRAIKATP